MIKVLFVCLGNICRSPMAEGVFRHHVFQEKLNDLIYCDSAGTAGYHIGERADHRMIKTASGYGIELTHRARQFSVSDFDDFHYIIPMDESNLRDILNLKKRMSGDSLAEIIKMRNFDPLFPGTDVPDPYYGGSEDFIEVYRILERSSQNFLQYLKKEQQFS